MADDGTGSVICEARQCAFWRAGREWEGTGAAAALGCQQLAATIAHAAAASSAGNHRHGGLRPCDLRNVSMQVHSTA